MQSNVPLEDVADILNKINEALEETDYVAIGYDNSECWLHVLIDKK